MKDGLIGRYKHTHTHTHTHTHVYVFILIISNIVRYTLLDTELE